MDFDNMVEGRLYVLDAGAFREATADEAADLAAAIHMGR
jgi:hypothetical protein